MSTYDKARELAKALAQSEEYKDYVAAKEQLEADEKNLAMLQEFRRQQVEIQMAQMVGEEIDETRLQQLESLYQLLSLNPTINGFLTAEYRFSRLLADIQKIIGDAVKEWFVFVDHNKHVN